MKTYTCKYCNKKFKGRSDREILYCSRVCAGKGYSKKFSGANSFQWRGNENYVYNCEFCDKDFEKRASRKPKYCSRPCADAAKRIRSRENRECVICGVEFWAYKKEKDRDFCCSQECSNKAIGLTRLGRRNPMWNGGKKIDGGGYVLIHKPMHPNSGSAGYIREHRLVMSAHIGRPLKKREVVHHINGDKKDNRIDNLELFENQSEHEKKHYHFHRSLQDTCCKV